jgi:hypothetical protein
MSSSAQLHPATGARFVCERVPGPEPVYRFAVHAAGGRTDAGELRWDADGRAVATPACADPWAHAELLKLARVLKSGGQARLTRWRGP